MADNMAMIEKATLLPKRFMLGLYVAYFKLMAKHINAIWAGINKSVKIKNSLTKMALIITGRLYKIKRYLMLIFILSAKNFLAVLLPALKIRTGSFS